MKTRLIWLSVVIAVTLGIGVPIYRAASQGSGTSSDTNTDDTSSLPPELLQLFQKQANSPPWNQDSPAKTQSILQQCAALQELLTDGAVHPGTTLASTQALVTSYIHTTGTPSWYSQECPTCPWPPYGPQNLWSTNSFGYTNIPSGWQFFQRGS
jgi:hypothetical protein